MEIPNEEIKQLREMNYLEELDKIQQTILSDELLTETAKRMCVIDIYDLRIGYYKHMLYRDGYRVVKYDGSKFLHRLADMCGLFGNRGSRE